VVAAFDPVYSQCMLEALHVQVYRVIRQPGPRLVLRGEAPQGAAVIVFAGYRGGALPERLTRPEWRAIDAAAESWRLSSEEGVFEFHARAIDRIELRPDFYAPLHGRFKLSATDRIAVRLLLWLLRFPGGAQILHWWQRRR
jgi:hypothetical protein